ncbi:hypothetical protein [Nocardiopsis valliformis]|uniref:hypothetical protein n=1 Tax=Nocardiopsis valliformis TaxID=239974 RepID=UPI001267DA0D|nr:hypothetical protein [Nocardiopsis valliformis]
MKGASFSLGAVLGFLTASAVAAGFLFAGVVEFDIRSHKNFGELERESDGLLSGGGLVYTVTSVREGYGDPRFVYFDAVVANNSNRYQENTIPDVYCLLPDGEHHAEPVRTLNHAGIYPSDGSMGEAAVFEYRCEMPEGMELHHVSVILETPKGSRFSFVDPVGSAQNVRRSEGVSD